MTKENGVYIVINGVKKLIQEEVPRHGTLEIKISDYKPVHYYLTKGEKIK